MTSTPSTTDSSRRSSATGDPGGTSITAMPRSAGAATVSGPSSSRPRAGRGRGCRGPARSGGPRALRRAHRDPPAGRPVTSVTGVTTLPAATCGGQASRRGDRGASVCGSARRPARSASSPLRSASRARAVCTWLVVLCRTDSKLAIRESMKRSVSRRSAAASASASALICAASSSATWTTSLSRASAPASSRASARIRPASASPSAILALAAVDDLLGVGDLVGQVGDDVVDRGQHLAAVDHAGRRHRHRACVEDQLAQPGQLLLRRGLVGHRPPSVLDAGTRRASFAAWFGSARPLTDSGRPAGPAVRNGSSSPAPGDGCAPRPPGAGRPEMSPPRPASSRTSDGGHEGPLGRRWARTRCPPRSAGGSAGPSAARSRSRPPRRPLTITRRPAARQKSTSSPSNWPHRDRRPGGAHLAQHLHPLGRGEEAACRSCGRPRRPRRRPAPRGALDDVEVAEGDGVEGARADRGGHRVSTCSACRVGLGPTGRYRRPKCSTVSPYARCQASTTAAGQRGRGVRRDRSSTSSPSGGQPAVRRRASATTASSRSVASAYGGSAKTTS